MSSAKINYRSSYNSGMSKQKENLQNAFYLSETSFVTIYHAQLFQKYLMLCTKRSINIYNTETFVKEHEINVRTHFACFIPFTTLLVYPQLEDNIPKVLIFWNYQTKSIQAAVTFNFQIQSIKASRKCIVLASLQRLYVLHFPSLKPIYQGFAGNGFKVVYDISREGLTIAHQTQKKGELLIRNFTNIKTNKLLTDIHSRSRGQSISKIAASQTKRQYEGDNQQEIKSQISIKAHTQNVVLTKLSPNGYRVITASTNGTVVRLFSTLSGQLISQFRMSNDISPVVDAQFISEGSQIVCLNESNQVNLFHARMSETQLISQSARKGMEIYQQKNPQSFFSFLSFINLNLKNQYPFAYFKLDTKGIQLKEKKEKLQAQLLQKAQKPKSHYITEIKQVQQSHLEAQSQLIEQSVQISKNFQKNQAKSQAPDILKSIDFEQVEATALQPKTQHKASIQKKNSISGVSKFESIKAKSIGIKHKQSSIKSLGKISRKPTDVVKFGDKEVNMHFKGIVNFGDTTNIKVFQSKYFFQLKYDPFNGGQMVEKLAINILKNPLFSDL